MVDYILKQLADMATNFFEGLIAGSVGVLSCNMSVFEEAFPIVGTLYAILQGLAIGLILTTIVWQAFKVFGMPLGLEAEDPIKVFFKGIIATFLVFFSKDIILDYVFPLFQGTYDRINEAEGAVPEAWTWAGLQPDAIELVWFTGTAVIKLLIVSICLCLVYFNFFKLVLEIVERYILVGVLVYTSPLAFSTLPSVTTSNIFKSWMNMVLGQLMMLVLNIWTIKMFFSIMSSDLATTQFMLWFFLTLGFLKVAQRLDSYMQQIGMSVGTTGNALGGAVLGLIGAQMGGSLIRGAAKGLMGGGFGGAAARGAAAAAGAGAMASVAAGGVVGGTMGGAAKSGIMKNLGKTAGKALKYGSTPYGVYAAGVGATKAHKMAKAAPGSAKSFVSSAMNKAGSSIPGQAIGMKGPNPQTQSSDFIKYTPRETTGTEAKTAFKNGFKKGENVPEFGKLDANSSVTVGNGRATVTGPFYSYGKDADGKPTKTTSKDTYQFSRTDMYNKPSGTQGKDWSMCKDVKGVEYYVTKTSQDGISHKNILNQATPKK